MSGVVTQPAPWPEAETVYDLGIRFDGCPCFFDFSNGGDFKAEGHCWRTCHSGSCCLHYEGNHEKARQLKALLDKMDWYGEWLLVKGLRRAET